MSQNLLSAAVVIGALRVKLLTEHQLEFLSLKGGCTGSSDTIMSQCHIAGNHIAAQLFALPHLSHLKTPLFILLCLISYIIRFFISLIIFKIFIIILIIFFIIFIIFTIKFIIFTIKLIIFIIIFFIIFLPLL